MHALDLELVTVDMTKTLDEAISSSWILDESNIKCFVIKHLIKDKHYNCAF